MAAPLSNALAGMSLGGGNDWGNPDAKPTLFTAELQGFAPEKEDIFYFFNAHPNLPTIADDEIEDILTDNNAQEDYPVARLIVRNRGAALRALNFSHQLFDGREIIVTVDGLSLDDATAQQPPQEEQPVHEPEPQRPVPVEQPPVRQEQPPQEQYGSRVDEAAPKDEQPPAHQPEPQPPVSAEPKAWKPRKPRDEPPAPLRQEENGARGGSNNYGGGGGGFNDRGNDQGGGGYGSGYARRDEGDRGQGGGYGVGGGGAGGAGRYGDRPTRGGDETLEMDADALAAASSGRPRLNLKKRSGGPAKSSSRPVARPAPSRSSIFGNAKPREEVLRAKGVDPNAVRPARKEQQDTTSIRGGGNNNNRGGPAPQMDGKNAPPVVKNENVFDVLDAE